MVGRHRRHTAPVVDAGADQRLEFVRTKVGRRLDRHRRAKNETGDGDGPEVLLERRVAIDPDETSGELLARLAPIGAAALLEAIDGLASGTLVAQPQDHTRATHAPMLAKADGAIDFAQPAAAVAARIRGVDPWPGAQAMLRGQLTKLFRARPAEGTGAPGTVLAIDAAGARIATSDIDRDGLVEIITSTGPLPGVSSPEIRRFNANIFLFDGFFPFEGVFQNGAFVG